MKYVPISTESVKSVFYFFIPWRAASGIFRSRIRESANPLGSRNHGISESVDPKKKRLPACMSCCHGNAIVLRVFNLNNESHYSLARCVCHDNCTVNLSHSKSPSLKRNKYCRVCALPCPSLITRFSCVFMRDSRGTRTTSSSEEAIRKCYEREAQAKELSIAAPTWGWGWR